MGFAEGSLAYLVESSLHVRQVRVLKVSGGLYTIGFEDGNGATCVRRSRLFETEETARASIQKPKLIHRSHHSWY